MIIGVPNEILEGEKRVAVSPSNVPALQKAGFSVIMEVDAGLSAGFTDKMYEDEGVRIVSNQDELFTQAKIILHVRGLGTTNDPNAGYTQKLKNTILIGLLDPFNNPDVVKTLASNNVQAFAMELVPRITRAQSMDVLSSQANIAGYKAALIAADALPKMFPMMMTSAGTATPARVFIIGAGVAGLQAIATCNRLGAIVSAYDIRPAVKEQVQSLGAKFVEFDLETGESEDKGGYAKEMDDAFYKKQQQMMRDVIAEHDVVITTAAIPGKKAPVLVTADMVSAMKHGSVIVDLAAESGGNCEVTKPGETIDVNGVQVIGPMNVPSMVPFHASQMYSKNLANFLALMVNKEGKFEINKEDEVITGSLVTDGGAVVHEAVKQAIG
ncbi:MAG: Re/Si-specific NAD(P)(+) transhydrogenase subunit alpha [Candidatus Dadabacteria bacterium]|nr:Re/Si-specific NAD(P)(+) transhydrogenase subunit alpha [Candidatus Dadabacteria bacterium]NIS07300.1 Re/Si-specific NAD(P)(+) transhydrogenase subunit alpha [Candidatus Dadabacteria bacterium]NIY21575.1 Re/Si-specific NAD(P)(+) transhydrogenase subunit alpha [Candidatus Dadabacteria bacterium]